MNDLARAGAALVATCGVVVAILSGAGAPRLQGASAGPRVPQHAGPEVISRPLESSVIHAPPQPTLGRNRPPARQPADNRPDERSAGPIEIQDSAVMHTVARWWQAYRAWQRQPAKSAARRALARICTPALMAALNTDPPRRSWLGPVASRLSGVALYRDGTALEAVVETSPGLVLVLGLVGTRDAVRVSSLNM